MSDGEGKESFFKIIGLNNKYDELLEQYIKDKETVDKDNVNLFSSISDKYKYENFNSDIIRFILDPKAIGDKIYLQEFLKFIGVNKFFEDESDIEVLREKNRIDVLIKNNKKKKAVIIESKINDANDQPMQLVRYYKKIKEDGFNVVKIVYLTKYPKRPDLKYKEGYDITQSDFDKLREDVKCLLFKMFISDGGKTKEYSKFQDYLEREEIKESDIIKQYKKLIDKLGGNILMSEEKLIKEIFSNKEDISKAKKFIELWETHASVLCNIFNSEIDQKPNKEEWSSPDGDDIYYFKIDNNKRMFYCAETNEKGMVAEVGFRDDKKKSFKGEKKQLEKILKESIEENQLVFNESLYIEKNSPEWLYIGYYYDETIEISAFCDKVNTIIETVQEKVKQI